MHRLRRDIDDISLEHWAQHAWRGRWESSNYQVNTLIACPSSKLPDYDFNEVSGYCSGLAMVDMQVSCIELVCVRMQIVYVVQFKLLNTY